MDKFPKEMLIEIALELNMKNIIKFCRTNKKINSAVCENENFWRQKLLKDYPNYSQLSSIQESYRKKYLRIDTFYHSINTACQRFLNHFFGESQKYMNKSQYTQDFKNAVLELQMNKEKLDDYELLDFEYDFRIKHKHLFPAILQNVHSQRVLDIIHDSPDDPLNYIYDKVNFDVLTK